MIGHRNRPAKLPAFNIMTGTIPLDRAVLKCLSFTSNPELGYEPYRRIVTGQKTHTLRTRRKKAGIYECSIDRSRRGVIVEITHCEEIPTDQVLTDDFARDDGIYGNDTLTPAEALSALLNEIYPELPKEMVLLHFDLLYWRTPGDEWIDTPMRDEGFE